MPSWYFAYGSNMCAAIFRQRRGMRPRAARVAWLDGHQLCFDIPVGPGSRGVANLALDPAARVCGVAYLLEADALDRLDRSEGVHLGLYRRLPVDLRLDGEERLAAFTYQSSLITTGRMPSPRYMGLLLDGATEHGLPPEYVQFLRAFELAIDEREGRG
jgi:cation transport regulator ChaC